MSTISDLIFNGAPHKLSSPYGPRKTISTSAGNTSSFHYGADYSTGGKKIAQYAIEDGEIISCGRDSAANGNALFVWVKYPRIGKKMIHYHLDSISVKRGQAVKRGTLLGYTGMTGKATGVHLHLGLKDLGTDKYEDPEAYAKKYVPVRKFRAKKNVNVRAGHGMKFSTLCVISNGSLVIVTKTWLNEGSGATWGYVPELQGWVNLGHFEEV